MAQEEELKPMRELIQDAIAQVIGFPDLKAGDVRLSDLLLAVFKEGHIRAAERADGAPTAADGCCRGMRTCSQQCEWGRTHGVTAAPAPQLVACMVIHKDALADFFVCTNAPELPPGLYDLYYLPAGEERPVAWVDGAALRFLADPACGPDAYVLTSLNKSNPAGTRIALYTHPNAGVTGIIPAAPVSRTAPR